MKSGMLAAEAVYDALEDESVIEPSGYTEKLQNSWIYAELKAVRNIRPAFRFGLWFGLVYGAIDTYVFRGRAPWTFRHHADHEQLQPAAKSKKITYPKPDGVISFDRLSSVFLSGTNHVENQPVHLRLTEPDRAISLNWAQFNAPEQRYCPAGVYEIVGAETNAPKLQINAQNCVHCKTCDIKDPSQNITWVTPQGGDGPNYPNM